VSSNERILLQGAAGDIETAIAQPANIRGVAVIAHPHPLFGGTMDNKVVTTLEKAFLELDCAVVRFNFRGVGKSAGVHDEGRGEMEDALVVIAYARERFGGVDPNRKNGPRPFILAGFSFGGAVMLRVNHRLAGDLAAQQLVLIAPSMRHTIGYEAPPNANANTLVIHGDADDTVPLEEVMNWARPQGLPVVVIPGGEHFFHGRLVLLRELVKRWSRF